MKRILIFAHLLFAGTILAQSPGNALNFDGVNDMVVATGTPAGFSNLAANDFTFEAWVYPTSAIFSRIIYVQNSTSNFATLSTGGTANIYFYVVAGGVTYSIATTASLPLNQWTHVAAVWNSSTLTPQVYFNGILQSGAAGGTSSTGTSGLTVLGSRPGGFQYFPGSMDEVRIWSEARTQCQIQANMNAEFVAPQPTLPVYYKFNHGVAGGANAGVTVLTDINGLFNGTVTNFTLNGASSNWIASGATINVFGPTLDFGNVSATICSGESYIFGGQSYSVAGNYSDTTLNLAGCDSVTYLNLSVLSPSTSGITANACEQYNFNSTLLTSSGTYYDTVPAFNGCDSIITLDLTIYNAQSTSLNITTCDQYIFNSMVLTSSGIFYDTLSTVNGCDSIVTLDLIIHNSQSNAVSQTACDQYLFNGNLLTASGSYQDTLLTMNGCDSVVTLNLTIHTADVSVNQSANTLTANTLGAMYQWLDCNNGYSVISGATNQVFNVTTNGSYAVEVTENGCTDTSACFVYNTFGLSEETEMILAVFPNPVDGFINIQINGNHFPKYLILTNVNGQVLRTIQVNAQSLLSVDLSDLDSGLYFLIPDGKNNGRAYRIIKR